MAFPSFRRLWYFYHGVAPMRLSQEHLRPVDDLNINLLLDIVNHKNEKNYKKCAKKW